MIDRRLGALGVEPPSAGQRGLFGRGLRDVWLAQGAGRIEGVRAAAGGRVVVLPRPAATSHTRSCTSATSRDRRRPEGARRRGVGHAGDGAAGRRRGCRRRAGCARSSPSSCSCGRSSRTRRAQLCSSSRAQTPQLDHLSGARARPRAPGAVRRRDRGRAGVTARGSSCAAPQEPLVSGLLARDPPRRAGDPLRPRRARDDARRLRGRVPAHATCTARCSARRSSSCSATRSTSRGPSSSSRSTAPGSTSTTRSSQRSTRRSTGCCDPIVAAEERRAGAHLIGAAARRDRARPGRPARAQRPAQGRVRPARQRSRRARQDPQPSRRRGRRQRAGSRATPAC